MKIKIFILVLIAATSVVFAVDSYLESFTVYSDTKNVYLEWRPVTEKDISRYEIERSSSNQDFARIHNEKASGNSLYKYKDQDVYFKTGDDPATPQAKTIYTYRIKIIKKDNTYAYSNNIPITPKINSIRRTWGMIKELFR